MRSFNFPIVVMFLLFCSTYSFGQVKVSAGSTLIGSIKTGFLFKAELSYAIEGADTVYTLLYDVPKEQNPTMVNTIRFKASSTDIENLYQALKSFFTKENIKKKGYKLSVKLGDHEVDLLSNRMLGLTSVRFLEKNGSFSMEERQVDFLFGRTK
jgi:hypothetical protein